MDPDDHDMTRIQRPQMEFEPISFPLISILKQYPLPKVIQCDDNSVPSKATFNSNVDLNQPLLVYCERSVRKVCAKSLSFDDTREEFVAVGQDLLVPEDYNGWFAVLGDPNRVKGSVTVPHYRNVACLASSPCSTFLVGGSQPITALMIGAQMDRDQRPMCCQINPGDVLRKGSVYMDMGVDKSRKKKSKDKGTPSEGMKFLHCYDIHDREIFIPIAVPGVFYTIYQDGAPAKMPIMQMDEIVARCQFPVMVKLVYGNVPNLPCAFTETLLLTQYRMSHSVIASTLLNFQNINLELAVGNNMSFNVVKDTPALLESRAYKNAMRSCKDKVPSYIKKIKVMYGNLLSDERNSFANEGSPSGQMQRKSSASSLKEENLGGGAEVNNEIFLPPDVETVPKTQRHMSEEGKKKQRGFKHNARKPSLHDNTVSLSDSQKYDNASSCDSQAIYETIWNSQESSEFTETQRSSLDRPPSTISIHAIIGRPVTNCPFPTSKKSYDEIGAASVDRLYETVQSSEDNLYETLSPRSKQVMKNDHDVGNIAETTTVSHDQDDEGILGYETPESLHRYLLMVEKDCTDFRNSLCNVGIANRHQVRSTDSGVFDEELQPFPQPDLPSLSPHRPSNCGLQAQVCNESHWPSRPFNNPATPPDETQAPPLPARNKKTGKDSGDSSTVSSGSRLPWSNSDETNKELLIKELKKNGVKPSTELALRSLQFAEIISAVDSDEKSDDENLLIALLPKVGRIDLQKIAFCIRGLRYDIKTE